MAVTSYLISYKFHDPNHEPALVAALEIFEDRIHALASVWFVCTPWSADEIRAHLGRHLGREDSLVVEPLPTDKGWSGWVADDVREWLTAHLGQKDDGGQNEPGSIISR
jgi:hypothetical protein